MKVQIKIEERNRVDRSQKVEGHVFNHCENNIRGSSTEMKLKKLF